MSDSSTSTSSRGSSILDERRRGSESRGVDSSDFDPTETEGRLGHEITDLVSKSQPLSIEMCEYVSGLSPEEITYIIRHSNLKTDSVDISKLWTDGHSRKLLDFASDTYIRNTPPDFSATSAMLCVCTVVTNGVRSEMRGIVRLPLFFSPFIPENVLSTISSKIEKACSSNIKGGKVYVAEFQTPRYFGSRSCRSFDIEFTPEDYEASRTLPFPVFGLRDGTTSRGRRPVDHEKTLFIGRTGPWNGAPGLTEKEIVAKLGELGQPPVRFAHREGWCLAFYDSPIPQEWLDSHSTVEIGGRMVRIERSRPKVPTGGAAAASS